MNINLQSVEYFQECGKARLNRRQFGWCRERKIYGIMEIIIAFMRVFLHAIVLSTKPHLGEKRITDCSKKVYVLRKNPQVTCAQDLQKPLHSGIGCLNKSQEQNLARILHKATFSKSILF